ncbi:hypothetical protein ITP53_39460 [Nonomuraea sp. K274]|uniref:XRE family transcriptional regulator n=1 Tax=Nonomuraea cypriaca TaxID=1187855 RepID=A0A931AMJ4_9ACTN|nr:hypothetical protein [Nonomuraea cypriaca]MBF8191672.1 hypothetical protein [Nonomuraea cypriaca]
MSGEGYQVLLRARTSSKRLREKGFTWDQIADVLALTHTVSPLRLYRLAHGRTAAEVVALVNDVDPVGTACLREPRLYDFEAWPEVGRRPPARLLVMLAKIYQTAARSLVGDEILASYGDVDRGQIHGADFRDLDGNRRPSPNRAGRVTMEASAAVRPADKSALDGPACVHLLRAIGAEETDVKRRELLFELALVLGGAQALDFLRILTPSEGERLAGVLRNTWRVDEATVRTFEKLTMHARQADDQYGPATLLPVVNGHRTALAQVLARETMPPALHDRLLGAYVQMSQLAGFFAFDLLDYETADCAMKDGLRAALELGDPTSISYLHCWLGNMAAYQDMASTALDHAFAARSWTARSRSKLLRAMNDSLLSKAHAAVGDVAESARAHHSAVALAGSPKGGEPGFLYWVCPLTVERNAASALARLKLTRPAVAAGERSLAGLGPQLKRDRGFALVWYADALILAKEIPEAAAKLTEAADISSQHSSARLTDQLTKARTRLAPWSDNTHVRELDETLRARGLLTA